MTASYSDFIDLSPVVLTPSSESSELRAVAIVQGKRYQIIEATVELNAHGFTNSATVTLSIEGNPDFSIVLADATTAANSDYTPEAYFELWVGLFDTPQYGSLDTAGMIRLFLSIIEDYEAGFQENTITFQLRSIAADLVDTKITRLTMGEPVSTKFLAAQAGPAGLNYDSPSPALTKPITIQQLLGKEFVGGASFKSTVYRKSAGDLLIQGATFDDCDVWCEDDTIYYQQARNVSRGTPIGLIHGRDFSMREGVVGSHALRQSSNIRVDVHSFTPRTRFATRTRLQIDPLTGAVTRTSSNVSVSRSIPLFGTADTISTTIGATGTSTSLASSSGGAASGSSGLAPDDTAVEKYAFFVPNLDQPTCAKLATSIARQIASLEYRLKFGFAMKRNLFSKLRIVSAFAISGLPYANFNDTYYARRITHRLSRADGWQVSVDAVNHALLQGELS